MARRAIRASLQGISTIKRAFKIKRWTQAYLAGEVGCSRQTVWNLLQGNPTDRDVFMEICTQLGLNWEEIAESELPEPQAKNIQHIDALVQEIREKVKPNIRERCGTMRVLDMTQPIELTGERGIYTKVNILEKITGHRRLGIAELLQNFNPEDFDRFGLSRVSEQRVQGLEAAQRYSKLMVLGKPGAGKTTFLKYLAMQCIEGQYQTNRVPLFISLKDFAEASQQPDLLGYSAQQLSGCGLTDASMKAEQLLRQGRTLVLLDSLDEVRHQDTKRVLTQIRNISDLFHTNQFVITCRIAAKEYTFERFTEVEVADFDLEQIAIFAQNWFRLSDPVKAERFIQKLQENEPIQELATNPLLLTLLCLVFAETANFPANHSELYKEALDVLLKKWDAKRNIERDQVYKNLSLQRKEDLLSQIALITFEQKDYFFKQKMVEAHIADFIRNLHDTDPDPEVLRVDSEAILKSIEAQHSLLVERARGIYSFSHLTFHEYFTARKIVTSCNPYATDDPTLQQLVSHMTEKRWQKVFLLTIEMLNSADTLLRLMKARIDGLLAEDENLQQFLEWVNEKARSVAVACKSTAVRVFYFAISAKSVHHSNLILFLSLEDGLLEGINFGLNYAFDRDLDSDDIEFARTFDFSPYFARLFHELIDKDLALDLFLTALERALYPFADPYYQSSSPTLQRELEKLYDSLDQTESQVWAKQLRAVITEHRNIGHDWQFNDKQNKLLQQYYDANKLLVDCLNSDCYVSREVRQEIEETLLLPIAEIQKRQQVL
jgi:predicted NACHT family NTPase